MGDILNIYNVFKIILLRKQNVNCDFATMHFFFICPVHFLMHGSGLGL